MFVNNFSTNFPYSLNTAKFLWDDAVFFIGIYGEVWYNWCLFPWDGEKCTVFQYGSTEDVSTFLNWEKDEDTATRYEKSDMILAQEFSCAKIICGKIGCTAL